MCNLWRGDLYGSHGCTDMAARGLDGGLAKEFAIDAQKEQVDEGREVRWWHNAVAVPAKILFDAR